MACIRTAPLAIATAVIVCLVLGACSEDRRRGPDVDSGPGGVDSGSGGTDGGGGGTDGGGGGVDSGSGGTDGGGDACGFVAELDDVCALDSECDYGLHQTDCCGNQMAVGFLSSEAASFETREAACRATLPACDCPVGPVSVQDGSTTSEPSTIDVRCDMGACRTYVPAS